MNFLSDEGEAGVDAAYGARLARFKRAEGPPRPDELLPPQREHPAESIAVFSLGRADPATGVIDMYAGPTETELALFPTRVVALGETKSAYSFTMFKAPGTSDELFESQYESLRREFDNIRGRFTADHRSCRA